MVLKSFGCSFIYGSDLSDDNECRPNTSASNLTWPAWLAKDLNYRYQCYARPGSGNLQILERILSQLNDPTPSLFVIGWTWIDRYDYVTVENKGNWNRVGNQYWNTIMPGDTSQLAKIYYQELHNQFQDKLTTLINIKLTIDILNQKNIPFIMTYMDDLIFETKWHSTPAILTLQNYIRPYLTTFNNKTFLEYSKEKGFPISETLHPLEDAHRAAFELIKSYNLV